MGTTLFVTQRCKLSNDEFYGLTHLSRDDHETLCGITMNSLWYLKDEYWWYEPKDYEEYYSAVTCKMCKKLMRNWPTGKFPDFYFED